MKRSTTRIGLAAACTAMLGTAAHFGLPEAQDGLPVVPVAGTVSHLVNPRGGNIGVSVGDDGILLVDDLFADTVGDVEKSLASLAQGKPAYLVNTHWHGDHTGGNTHFGQAAVIVAHENVRRRLSGDETIGGRVAAAPAPAASLPGITYDQGLTLHFNGEEIELFHLGRPAHTDGDTVVWFKGSNVVHMGDLYFQVGYPYVDGTSGGDVRGIIAAVEGVLERVPEDAKFIPGHGQVTGVDGLRDYLEMLRTITQRVEELHAESFSVDEMMEAEVTSDYDVRWGGFAFVPPRKFVESVVASLEG